MQNTIINNIYNFAANVQKCEWHNNHLINYIHDNGVESIQFSENAISYIVSDIENKFNIMQTINREMIDADKMKNINIYFNAIIKWHELNKHE